MIDACRFLRWYALKGVGTNHPAVQGWLTFGEMDGLLGGAALTLLRASKYADCLVSGLECDDDKGQPRRRQGSSFVVRQAGGFG